MRNASYRVALGGIVAALCIVTMFLAGILPAFYILLPMIAGALMMIISAEVGREWALLTYAATSLLSMLITFDKEAALLFVMVFGHYPIIREYIKKLRLRPLVFLLKTLVFNVCIIGYFYVTVYVFGLDEMLDEFGDFGKYGAYIMLALANALFFAYDLNLDALYKIYAKRFAPKFKKRR